MRFEQLVRIVEEQATGLKTLTQYAADLEAKLEVERSETAREIARLEAHIANLSLGKAAPVDLPPIRPPAILRRLGLLPKQAPKTEP